MSSKPTSTTPRIAIIGAGPSGLVLLNVLARKGIPATLYERDEEFGSRAHLGGTLDLHVDSGQAAIKEAGLWDAFVQHSRPEGQEFIVADKSGEILHHYVPPADAEQHARPEIDRTMLRKIMVDGAPSGSIKWGHALVGASPVAGSAEWELTFANGHKVVVDVLVGADGGRSRVRPLVSDVPATYTTITGLEVSFESSKHPELSARIGEGSLFSYGHNQTIIAQRNGDGRIRTYAFFRHDDAKYVPNLASTNPDRAIAEVLARYEDWAPWLRQLVEVADRHAVYARSLYMLPVGHAWAHRPGVTLIGDAMNLMTPFAGKGANVAMLAGLKLGLALASVAGRPMAEVDARIAQYEHEMVPLAAKDAAHSEGNMKIALFNEDGSNKEILAMAQRAFQGP
ncbi:putative monooxygenase [Auricularia subglabra TFB-10046 SS5]|nr:putative monooxygenase [Auricularia subglabra TFB-10046 SS5]